MRQLGFGTVDLALHVEYDPQRDGDCMAYAWEILNAFAPAPLPAEHACSPDSRTCSPARSVTAPATIRTSGRKCWTPTPLPVSPAEGIFNPRVGRAFRENILAKGDSEDPEKLFRAFMGRGPDAEALMRRIGLAA